MLKGINKTSKLKKEIKLKVVVSIVNHRDWNIGRRDVQVKRGTAGKRQKTSSHYKMSISMIQGKRSAGEEPAIGGVEPPRRQATVASLSRRAIVVQRTSCLFVFTSMK